MDENERVKTPRASIFVLPEATKTHLPQLAHQTFELEAVAYDTLPYS
jgi:hypothetical protein